MGSTIYFQGTKYQKNHSDTFSAMLYFILMWSISEQTGDLMVTGPSALQQLQNGISSLMRSSHVAQSAPSRAS